MFCKRFFGTMALGGVAVSLVGNVGSFAEESLTSDGGILFRCKNPDIADECYDFASYGVDLQLLVNHFRLDREETEKLLKCMKLCLDKYEKLCQSVKSDLSASDFPEVGQIGFSAHPNTVFRKGQPREFCFTVMKRKGNHCFGFRPDWLRITKSELNAMLACNLNEINFLADNNDPLVIALIVSTLGIIFAAAKRNLSSEKGRINLSQSNYSENNET